MTRILIEDVDVLAKPSSIDYKDAYKKEFGRYLPRDASGAYSVSVGGEGFEAVYISGLWDYPITQINYHSTGDECCRGVSENGISMLVFEKMIGEAEPSDIRLIFPPSFVTIYGDRIQFGFVLYEFIPGTMSEATMSLLEAVITELETVFGAKNVDKIFIPCSPKVTAWISTHRFKYRFGLKDLLFIANVSSMMSAEQFINHQNRIKEGRANGGKAAAATRKAKSAIAIRRAFAELSVKKERVTQGAVAIHSGLSRKTVNEHWAECAI